MFKMMDRVMLVVNNSLRCRLRSLRPSHLIQSEAFTQSSDWRKHGENTGSSANEMENIVACSPHSHFSFLPSLWFE